MPKITLTLDNPERSQIDVSAVEVDGKMVVNLHSTTYNLLVAEPDSETGKPVNQQVSIRSCGYAVKVEYNRSQLRESPLPMRAFKMTGGRLSSPLPVEQDGVIFLVSPSTREFMTNTGMGREDVLSPYSIQEFRIENRNIKCATALAQ